MKAIYKYSLGSMRPGEVDVRMPSGLSILSVGLQRSEIVVWAQVDPNVKADRLVRFRKLHTGQRFDKSPGEFIGTVYESYEGHGGAEFTVVHVFRANVVETADGTIIEVV